MRPSFLHFLAGALSMMFVMVFANLFINVAVQANEEAELLTKQQSLQLEFDENNPEGNVDLKKIVEEELKTPEECNQPEIVCRINKVAFDITIKKEWLKLDITTMTDQGFAQSVPLLSNQIDQLTDSEVVIMQETLARRGLLTYLDGSVVQERGFFGSLTWLGLIRLAQIKGLDPGDPEFERKVSDEVNNLINNLANDRYYINNRPLPGAEEMTPGDEDPLNDMWDHYSYLSKLAQNADRVVPNNIPLNIGVDVNIDGYVNVERVE